MKTGRATTIKYIRWGAIFLIITLLVGYALSRSLNYARGPEIVVLEPANGASIYTATTTVSGHADRVNSLSLNGNPLSVDEKGNFKETVIIFPGINVLTFTASDQFGRNTQTKLTVLGAAFSN